MSISTLIRRMTEAGAPPEAIALAVEEIEAIQASLDARRLADRDRKRVQRERQISADVTGHSEDCPETVRDKSFLDKKPPHTPTKIKPILPPIFPQKVQAVWNEMAGKHGLPAIQSIDGKRMQALRSRTAEHGEDAVTKAIAAVPRSPHWLGENGWRGNFDSLLRPDNFRRLIEGTYDAKPTGSSTEPIPLYRQINQATERQAATQ